MTQIKICGLMTLQDIQAVNHLAVDYGGFVFAPGRHQLDLTTALYLRKQLAPRIKSVGVFVHEPYTVIHQIYAAGAIQIVQLHGAYNASLIQKLRRAHIPVIQVFQNQIPKETTLANYLMVDSGQGSGRPWSWHALPKLNKPLILAGGLTTANVQTAIRIVQPDIVDASSGLETAGHKDPDKIKRFVQKVKGVFL